MKKHIKDSLRLNTAVLSIKYNMEVCKYDSVAFAELEAAVMRAEKAMRHSVGFRCQNRCREPNVS